MIAYFAKLAVVGSLIWVFAPLFPTYFIFIAVALCPIACAKKD